MSENTTTLPLQPHAEGVPDDLIPGSHAASILGVSDMGLFYMRRDGRGPKAYEVMKGRQQCFMYSAREVMAFRRSRMDVEDRLTAVEQSLDRLTSLLATAAGG